MRLGVLGPLLVAEETGRQVHLAGRARALLAALALQANQVVSAERLVDLVLDGAPSRGTGSTMRSYVRRLRVELGPLLAERIVTCAPGYSCRVDEQEVDALRFEALCREAGTAVRELRWADASDAAGRAAALWRGVPLLDVPSQALRDEFVPRLEQLRVQVLEDHAAAELALGHHEQLVQPLRELAAEHPLRERFHAQLMLALLQAGRQAEALAVYRRARRVLIEELGVEPGAELRRLHERVLAGGDCAPKAPAPADQAQASDPATNKGAVLRQLPAAPGHFVGRRGELGLIAGLLEPPQRPEGISGTVLICAVDGMAGIGKTALAVHAAHRLADRFPDGQLFIDLHGYTQGCAPRSACEALGAFLHALGVPARQVPEDGEECAALYRQRLAGTKTLILLDNAADEAQVRPLLPGASGCMVLVTSRRRLKGLDDARSLSLSLLPSSDAIALLRAVAGPERVPADDPLPGEVVRLCGHLPLALRIAGTLLRHRPVWSLEHLAGLLRDQRHRVQALSDGERDLGAVFDLSYAGLDERHRRLCRRLCLVPGPYADACVAAALLNLDPDAATGLLEDLVDHNLLIAHTPGRYRLHDLIRAHARTLADTGPETGMSGPCGDRGTANPLRAAAGRSGVGGVSPSSQRAPAPRVAAVSPGL